MNLMWLKERLEVCGDTVERWPRHGVARPEGLVLPHVQLVAIRMKEGVA